MRKWKNPTNCSAYYSWRAMRHRCNNPNHHAYSNYGGRGIGICERWNSYDAFVEDMGFPPVGCSLDRINNNEGYSLENCRWATVEQQLNNQRRNIRVEYMGDVKTLSEWAKELGINKNTLNKRYVAYKMPFEKAITIGRVNKKKHGTRHGYETGCRCSDCKSAHAKRHREMRQKRRLKRFASEVSDPVLNND